MFLAVKSMSQHTTDEGAQLQGGLAISGYRLVGHGYKQSTWDDLNLRTAIVQDKREWDANNSTCLDPKAAFHGTERLRDMPDVFRLTIVKDAHQNPGYHRAAHDEIGTHAWITYYHPDIVTHLAPWIRPEHVVRTYHSIDSTQIPPFCRNRLPVLASGATFASVYPLRNRIKRMVNSGRLQGVSLLRHPGYGVKGCYTNDYLQVLNVHKVAICTASIYGYALRKIIEATACGCVVVTDLPSDEVLPGIDGNLIRIRPDAGHSEIKSVIHDAVKSYDMERQVGYSIEAMTRYDYKRVYGRLAVDIATMREAYSPSEIGVSA